MTRHESFFFFSSPLVSAYAGASADLCANPPKLQRRRVVGEDGPQGQEGGSSYDRFNRAA